MAKLRAAIVETIAQDDQVTGFLTQFELEDNEYGNPILGQCCKAIMIATPRQAMLAIFGLRSSRL